MDQRQQKIHRDAAKTNSQIGREYYSICDDNPNYFRTIRIARNPFTGNIQSQVSNACHGVPPEGIDEIPPLMKNRLNSCSNALPYSF